MKNFLTHLRHRTRRIEPAVDDFILNGNFGVNLHTPLIAAMQFQGFLVNTQLPVILAFSGQPGQLSFVNISFGPLINPVRGDVFRRQ